MVVRQADLIRATVQLADAFSPSAPIDRKELFAGRFRQINQVMSAVGQTGRHVILYGERGVGKTSLASLIHEWWIDAFKDSASVISPRINCDAGDNYESIWAKVIDEIDLYYQKRDLTFIDREGPLSDIYDEIRNGGATTDTVRRFLDLADKMFIIIIDEFDRLQSHTTVNEIADTIKTLSDHAVRSTLVLVGVADTVDELIEDHASIDRAVAQVLMPRMSLGELQEIVENGYKTVNMTTTDTVPFFIAQLSQGLPHYAHFLAQHAGFSAVHEERFEVTHADVMEALREAVDEATESITHTYHRACTSPRKENLYRQVLLACAMAKVDDLGYFAPADVREPLSDLMQRPYGIPAFIRHLNTLCTETKGYTLQSIGLERRRRFRFSNPLLRPYVVLRGIADNMIGEDSLQRLNT